MKAIEELQRIPSPSPAPQALSCDGDRLWIGSRDTSRIYGLEAHTAAVFEEGEAPGIPWGAVVTGDDIRFVLGEGPDDDRFIRRYIIGHGFKSESIPCPEFTGSYLGYDGENLYLSQFYKGRIFVIDSAGEIGRIIEVDPLSSRVLLLSDPTSRLPALVQRGRWWAIAVGTQQHVKLRFISQDAVLRVGDLVVTGEGRSFHAGIPIGRIRTVDAMNAGALDQSAIVDPAANLGALTRVLVVRK